MAYVGGHPPSVDWHPDWQSCALAKRASMRVRPMQATGALFRPPSHCTLGPLKTLHFHHAVCVHPYKGIAHCTLASADVHCTPTAHSLHTGSKGEHELPSGTLVFVAAKAAEGIQGGMP